MPSASVGESRDYRGRACLSLRTLFARSTLIGRGYLRRTEGPGRGLMYGGLVKFVGKPGMRSEFLEFLRWDAKVAKDTEPGTLRFDVWETSPEPDVIRLRGLQRPRGFRGSPESRAI